MNFERKIGDIVVDQFGQVCVLLEIDAGFTEPYDRGLSLRPKFGVPVRLKEYRAVIGTEQLLALAEEHGIDFTTVPQKPLTEFERLKLENENLMKRIEALEAAKAA